MAVLTLLNGLIGTVPKLQILRQLVDYQLQHSGLVRDIIDTVWGARPAKHRKGAKKEAPSPAAEGYTKKQLVIEPIGQDRTRKRFWTLDGMLKFSLTISLWSLRLYAGQFCSCGEYKPAV